MTVIFDAEPLLAFSFDEPGAESVERWLDRIYDGETDGYISTINLAEVRYIAARKTTPDRADAHIEQLRDMGVTEYPIDDLWRSAADLKVAYSPAIGDAYAVAAALSLDADDDRTVTLLVGGDDDYEVFERDPAFSHLIERFRGGQG